MTKPFSQTNTQRRQFSISKYLIAQMMLPTVLQLVIAPFAAQSKPTNPGLFKPVQSLNQCHWSVSQDSEDQFPKVAVANWQSLAPEVESLIALVENSSQLAFQSQLMITNADVAIGGGDDPETLASDHCWKGF